MIFTLPNHQKLTLLPSKSIFWEEKKILIIADPHFGKTAHFQKHGISVSSAPFEKDIELLEKLIFEYEPKTLLILGDFFHSDVNQEWEKIKNMFEGFSDLKIILVKGNHDKSFSKLINHDLIEIVDVFEMENIIFSHYPLKKLADNQYNIHGHVHPAITISGKGKQSITLPCFVFAEKNGIMPAFGSFTGNYGIGNNKDNAYFLITPDSVLPFKKEKK